MKAATTQAPISHSSRRVTSEMISGMANARRFTGRFNQASGAAGDEMREAARLRKAKMAHAALNTVTAMIMASPAVPVTELPNPGVPVTVAATMMPTTPKPPKIIGTMMMIIRSQLC